MTVDDLFKVLGNKTGFQKVSDNMTDTQLRIIGRLPRNVGVQGWLLVANALLERSEQADWKIDISKQYFRKNNQIVYGWRLIIQAADVAACLPDIIQVVSRAPRPAQREVNEMVLMGQSGSRNDTSATGKGAGLSGKVAVGPLAISRIQRGG